MLSVSPVHYLNLLVSSFQIVLTTFKELIQITLDFIMEVIQYML